MIEIIAGIWITSFLLSSLVMTWNLMAIRRQLNSPSLRLLNANLARVNLFWSNVTSDFAPLSETAIELDRAKTMKNAALLGICCLASLPGFLFLLVIVLSMRVLARERKERAVFQSDLAQKSTLLVSEINALVESLRKVN